MHAIRCAPNEQQSSSKIWQKQSIFGARVVMTEDFIQTRCARLKKNVRDNFVSVEYVAHKKKVPVLENSEKDIETLVRGGKRSSGDDQDGNVDPKKQQELAMKRARYDVIKFGMSGLKNVEAKRVKVASAIALGARPPKNRRSNYKKLKENRRRAKESAIKKERVSGADKSLVKRKTRRKRGDKDSGILGIYGKVQKGPGKS